MKRKKQKIDLLRTCRIIFTAAIFLAVLFFVISTIRESAWDGTRRFTVVVDADPLLLFSIEPISHQAVLVIIPANALIDVPFGYSTYPARAVFRLGTLDPKRGGGKLLSKGIENTFGVAVDGFFASKNENRFMFPSQSEKLLSLKKSYFSLLSVLPDLVNFQVLSKNLVTNLSAADIAKLWIAVHDLRSDQIAIINLDQSSVATNEKLPDGTLAKVINQDMVDQMVSSDFQDQLVRLQNVSVEVVNATDVGKVASQFSRILQNMGANVIMKSTATQAEQFNCKIFVARKDLMSSIIIDRLTKFYNCATGSGQNSSVADIKVVLGEEFIQ